MIDERKIAIYNLNTYPEMSGGCERSCLELAKELIRLGEDVRVISLNPFLSGVNFLQYEGVRNRKITFIEYLLANIKKEEKFFKKGYMEFDGYR